MPAGTSFESITTFEPWISARLPLHQLDPLKLNITMYPTVLGCVLVGLSVAEGVCRRSFRGKLRVPALVAFMLVGVAPF